MAHEATTAADTDACGVSWWWKIIGSRPCRSMVSTYSPMPVAVNSSPKVTGTLAGAVRPGRAARSWISTHSCRPSLAKMAFERPRMVFTTPRFTLARPSAEMVAMRSGVQPAAIRLAVMAPAEAPATLANQVRRAATAWSAPA